MKKLSTSLEWFGPFNSIIENDFAFACDGIVMPKDIVGNAIISNYDPETDIRPIPQELIDQQWGEVRTDRNKRLADCDWTQLPDAPVGKLAWAAYRQELRDITTQPDPFNIVWPIAPGA